VFGEAEEIFRIVGLLDAQWALVVAAVVSIGPICQL
jgi:hypothetical protein